MDDKTGNPIYEDEDEYGALDYDSDELQQLYALMDGNGQSSNLPSNLPQTTSVELDLTQVTSMLTDADFRDSEITPEALLHGGTADGTADGEDDGVYEGNGINEDSDDEGDSSKSTESKHRKRLPTMPQWLRTRFNKCLADCRNRDAHGWPSLYQQGLFWFPQRATFFTLDQVDQLMPSDVYPSRFFLWDPIVLIPKDSYIPCVCGKALEKMGSPTEARSMVGFSGVDYIIAFRYRCKNCSEAQKHGRTYTTFVSSSPYILSKLPRHLAREFPAILTHRRAISKELFNLMRSCFQSGMGSMQFADALRVQANRRHDETHLQYLQAILSRCLRTAPSIAHPMKYVGFPEFSDSSPEGPNNYTPSSQLLRDVYDNFIEQHEAELDQHTAMLPATVCAIDHSHKVHASSIK